jgi:hypothetical protein
MMATTGVGGRRLVTNLLIAQTFRFFDGLLR